MKSCPSPPWDWLWLEFRLITQYLLCKEHLRLWIRRNKVHGPFIIRALFISIVYLVHLYDFIIHKPFLWLLSQI